MLFLNEINLYLSVKPFRSVLCATYTKGGRRLNHRMQECSPFDDISLGNVLQRKVSDLSEALQTQIISAQGSSDAKITITT